MRVAVVVPDALLGLAARLGFDAAVAGRVTGLRQLSPVDGGLAEHLRPDPPRLWRTAATARAVEAAAELGDPLLVTAGPDARRLVVRYLQKWQEQGYDPADVLLGQYRAYRHQLLVTGLDTAGELELFAGEVLPELRREAPSWLWSDFQYVRVRDPRADPLFRELHEEYRRRYGDINEMTRFPDAEFAPPHGAFLLLFEEGMVVAGGAFRRVDEWTAELKRIWTHSAHRRRGLARRVLAELEREAARRGYRRLCLKTGPKQPEARALYLRTGYRPLFDVREDQLRIGPLPFEKDLVPAGMWPGPLQADQSGTPSPVAPTPR